MFVRIISRNDEEAWIKLKPESVEDLWYLSRIIEAGDRLEATTQRRYRPPGATKDSGEKKVVKMAIKIESVDFAEAANKLRVTGVIESGTPEEYVQVGEHHTIDIEPHHAAKLFKKMNYAAKAVLKEAMEKSRHAKGIVVLMDEHKALATAVETRGARHLFEIENTASKRQVDEFEAKRAKFFSEITDTLLQRQADAIIIAGPGFQKDAFKKFLQEKAPELLKKTVFEHASSAERTALRELLKEGVVKKALGSLKLSEELELLEKFKASLGKNDGLNAYGIDAVKNAVETGAAGTVMVSDELLRKSPEARRIMENAEKTGARVVVFDSQSDAGGEFSSFGVAALLRYKAT